jgi:hypothetical protein|tara:strand:- start:125 stop:262 length:138 start_codon:yes stop_codon:yes gene_type:complete
MLFENLKLALNLMELLQGTIDGFMTEEEYIELIVNKDFRIELPTA